MKKRLDVLLVERGLATSREKAKAMIMAGEVLVDNEREDKAGSMFPEEVEIVLKGKPLPYVSRGGLKLEKAMKNFNLTLDGKVCMDVGASTGGFTDCMLQNGAVKVYAVDVGYGQLAWSLRTDERVVNMERILRDSLSAAQAGERLNAEGMRRQEEIDALTKRFKQRLERFEKGASDMSESERVTERRELAEMERDVARRSREARDEFNQRRNEEVLLLQGRAGRIIQQIAETEKFDLVLYEFFYASPKVDITDRVMKALDADVKPAKKKK